MVEFVNLRYTQDCYAFLFMNELFYYAKNGIVHIRDVY